MVQPNVWKELSAWCNTKNITLVAVSKTKPVEDILALYELGQRDFGENYVQELLSKHEQLPADIRWHFLGHLQTNKVKYIAPFVHLIHAIDSSKLLQEVAKHVQKLGRCIDVLLQMHIANEDTKFGMDETQIEACVQWYKEQPWADQSIRVCGLMGMASFTENTEQVRQEFLQLTQCFHKLKQTYFEDNATFTVCSIGMSGDYEIAAAVGGNMIRIGSMLFGKR